MAMAGIESAIPTDEVIDAMKAVGDTMPCSLRETGEGGLAATPTGKKYAESLPNYKIKPYKLDLLTYRAFLILNRKDKSDDLTYSELF